MLLKRGRNQKRPQRCKGVAPVDPLCVARLNSDEKLGYLKGKRKKKLGGEPGGRVGKEIRKHGAPSGGRHTGLGVQENITREIRETWACENANVKTKKKVAQGLVFVFHGFLGKKGVRGAREKWFSEPSFLEDTLRASSAG